MSDGMQYLGGFSCNRPNLREGIETGVLYFELLGG